jgi:4-hydroxy-3-methylbut-2-enyl diphosphate reductase
VAVAKNAGFCFGVKKAVDAAMKNAGENTFTYGELIHNETVADGLKAAGVRKIDSASEFTGGKVVIRSHGVSKSEYDALAAAGAEIIDATCPFVKKIHGIAADYSHKGYTVVIIGAAEHPEVKGIAGWVEGEPLIIDSPEGLKSLAGRQKVCFVAQTTFDTEKYRDIIKKIDKEQFKTVEIFDTICYTTYRRQSEAARLAARCGVMLVLGSPKSSNTQKLFGICRQSCAKSYLVDSVAALKSIEFSPTDYVGIVTGASTPGGLIEEVKVYMGQQFEEVSSKEFIDGVEESLVSYKEGKRVRGTVIAADESGIKLRIGGKKDGFIPKDEIDADGVYDPDDYVAGSEVDALITNKQDKESGCVLLSKKKIDLIKEGDKVVESIRDGEVFEFVAEKETKGGLLGKLGTYAVFIPASQIKEGFVKDLRVYAGKPLRLTALEIDDDKHKIVASQRKVLERERKAREEIFWSHVQPDVIVSGKVKRFASFGAFVSVDGFDCLAHIVDLSWTHVKSADEVLTIGETYDFLVLAVDRERGRVSLSYKLLQPHPFEKCLQDHPVGSVCKGKITSIVPFGAFVEIEPGIEGLVHVSEASRNFIKNVGEVAKVGDEVEVMILNADPASKKLTLSIKAALPDAERPADADGGQNAGSQNGETEWSEDNANMPFADLLKDLDMDKK